MGHYELPAPPCDTNIVPRSVYSRRTVRNCSMVVLTVAQVIPPLVTNEMNLPPVPFLTWLLRLSINCDLYGMCTWLHGHTGKKQYADSISDDVARTEWNNREIHDGILRIRSLHGCNLKVGVQWRTWHSASGGKRWSEATKSERAKRGYPSSHGREIFENSCMKTAFSCTLNAIIRGSYVVA